MFKRRSNADKAKCKLYCRDSVVQQSSIHDVTTPRLFWERHIDRGNIKRLRDEALASFSDIDLTDAPDLEASLNAVLAAETAFAALTPAQQAFFDHDYVNMYDFVQDANNHDAAVALGLAKPRSIVTSLANGDKSQV